jgi:hypothetical protein
MLGAIIMQLSAATGRLGAMCRPHSCHCSGSNCAQVPGQTESFLQHMQLGVRAAAGDPAALLVFSGGQTREGAGARSEAQSYRNVAHAAGWFGHPEVQTRAVTEVTHNLWNNITFRCMQTH